MGFGAWRVDWGNTIAALTSLRGPWLLASVASLCASFACFAQRWRYVLDSPRPLPARTTFSYLMIGYMANALLPMRPGDLLRAAIVRQWHTIAFARAVSSIVVERVLDVTAVVFLGFALTLVVELPMAVTVGLYTFAALAGAAVLFLVGLSLRRDLLRRLLSRLPPSALLEGLIVRAELFADALTVLHQPSRLVRILAWHVLGWTGVTLSMIFLLYAMHLPAPWVAAVLVVVTVNLGAAIPSSPGALGVFHALAVLALSVWAVPTPESVAFAIVAHGIAITLHITLGAASAWLLGMRGVLSRARELREASPGGT
ncbi:MAG: flippase-like domain-containing protein [Gammaproteobacteria bacterium]|nr:flippase-like domain-containing protein [Gammaproteobacteria bacterium]